MKPATTRFESCQAGQINQFTLSGWADFFFFRYRILNHLKNKPPFSGRLAVIFFSQQTLLRRSASALPRIFSMSSAKNAFRRSKKPFLTVTFCVSLSARTVPSLPISFA